MSEYWGASPATIDSCLRVADFHDVVAILDTDSMYESYGSDLQNIIKNRVVALPFNQNLFKSAHLYELLTQNNIIGISSMNDLDNNKLEEYLNDLGIISVLTSSSSSPMISTNQSQVINRINFKIVINNNLFAIKLRHHLVI